MRSLTIFGMVLALASAGASASQAQARDSGQDRKVVQRVLPSYPDLARRLNLAGIVRVEVRVAASGAVKATKVVGGNPVLAEAAVSAIRQWKYEAAPAESVELIELRFDGKK